ncbi:MAG: acetylxylan esterase, partial [Pirellulaceae bacterium]|nr:acetylxylan esterase [Pirellulaceae bacterium]
PGFLVTGNLYVPQGTEPNEKMPAVLGVCGHSTNGKAAEAYQSFAQGLARLGFVTFIVDPIGQGERLQYLEGRSKSRYSIGVGEHIQMGNAQTLVGEFLGTWFAWDAMRGLDYLLSRPEVDPKHVGVTGNSGGGTQTTWLCGLESRWTMAAPACFVTTFLRNLENELPADTEQCPPRALALGLDHADFLAALAPKPTLILAQERDYFDARGAEAAHARLNQLYHQLGKSDQTQLHIGPEYHGYSQVNREAMYRFFSAVTGRPAVKGEPKLVIETDETLTCTPQGQVGLIGSITVPALTRQRSQELAKSRPKLVGPDLIKSVKQVLRLPSDSDTDTKAYAALAEAPDYRILRNVGKRNYPMPAYCVYAVETEPGIHALVTRLSNQDLMSRPPRGDNGRAVLYVAHWSSDDELRTEPLVSELLKGEPNSAFYACDVRGIGESKPDVCGANQFLRPYGSDYFHAAHSLMIDRPFLGQKTLDVLRVVQWLKEQGHGEVHVVGRGWGALPAMFAALLSDDIQQVTLKNCLTSYADIAETEDYNWPYAVMLPGVLKHFDLPQCKAALVSKNLRDLAPWTAKP